MAFIVKGRNNSFVCEHCGRQVAKAKGTVRDHCPFCLYSKHVDNSPGDRMCRCGGLMKPIGYRKIGRHISILYKCLKCGYKHFNVKAEDDNFEEIIKLPIVG